MTPQQWVEQQLPNMEAMLKKLVAIPSVQGSPTDQAPYGKAPLACLEEYLRQAKELGFDVSLEDQRMGEVRWGAGAPGLAILGHLDVVPGWTEGNYPSYELSKEDGVYYGRGVIDDKGPMVSALFALYYFLDQGISLKTPALVESLYATPYLSRRSSIHPAKLTVLVNLIGPCSVDMCMYTAGPLSPASMSAPSTRMFFPLWKPIPLAEIPVSSSSPMS